MKEFAIKENHLFVKTYSKGKRYSTPRLCVYVLKDLRARRVMIENPQKKYLNRIGFSASPKLGNAVKRNRCKRIMRAGYRKAIAEAPIRTGNLIVIAAREGALNASSAEICLDLTKAFGQLGLTIKSDN